MKGLILLTLLVSIVGLQAYDPYGPGDIISSFALPYGFFAASDCAGVCQVKGKIYCTQLTAAELWLGNADTGVWEKSWSTSGLDASPYDLGISASSDTLIMVGNANFSLYFLDAADPTSVLGSVLLDQTTTGTSAPNYLTGCTYLLDFKGKYRVLVVDRDNYFFYEVDPIAMEYKDKYAAPTEFSVQYWLRGLDYDTNAGAMTMAIPCFNAASVVDSGLLVEVNQNNNFAKRTDLDGSKGTWGGGPGYFILTAAYDSTGLGNYNEGLRTHNNIRACAYNNNFMSGKYEVHQGAGLGFTNDPGIAPAAVYCYGGFFGSGFKQTTWGGIKKMYSNVGTKNHGKLSRNMTSRRSFKPSSARLTKTNLPRMSVR
jgi:hypothetical protein